jgi:septal ring factor EnvC (AmiA/AmiB activator)
MMSLNIENIPSEVFTMQSNVTEFLQSLEHKKNNLAAVLTKVGKIEEAINEVTSVLQEKAHCNDQLQSKLRALEEGNNTFIRTVRLFPLIICTKLQCARHH